MTTQRICLQQMKLEIKLDDILTKQVHLSLSLMRQNLCSSSDCHGLDLFSQMVCLEDWAILEREHVSSLAGAIADLEANTLRLPLTGGTKVYMVYLFIE